MADADTPSRQPSPAILVIGEFFSPEMSAVRLCVESLSPRVLISVLSPSVPKGTAGSDAPDWFPDLVVVCQHWPDEFTEHEVRRLLTLYPLVASDLLLRSLVPVGRPQPRHLAVGGPRTGRRRRRSHPPRAAKCSPAASGRCLSPLRATKLSFRRGRPVECGRRRRSPVANRTSRTELS